MDWTTVDFTGITSEVAGILPEVIPVAIGLFAIIVGLGVAKYTINMFRG